MIDRDNSVFKVPRVSFPARKRPGDGVKSTLLDGVSYHGDGALYELGVSIPGDGSGQGGRRGEATLPHL